MKPLASAPIIILMLFHAGLAGPPQLPAETTVVETEVVVQVSRPEIVVTLSRSPEKLQIDMTDPRGIGRLKLVRHSEHWPEQMDFIARLRGLEQFQVTAGKHILQWSVRSEPPFSFHQSARVGSGAEQELTEGAPFFASVVPLTGDNGFRITLPGDILKSNPATLEFQWIDFYR